jgi:hypothetical protein
MRRGLIIGFLLVVAIIGMQTHSQSAVEACGGLFCQNVLVSQSQEKIIFTVNNDGTMSAYVQIYFTGSASDFSWVVPVPNTPEVDVAEESTFEALTTLTTPKIIPPAVPGCAMRPEATQGPNGESGSDMPMMPTLGNVDVLKEGNVGPYNYAVITSDDPDALVVWLAQNNYRITQSMVPLIHLYNDEDMVFLAMKLKGEAGVQDIQPVKLTYRSERPMIPLRLTAVAAEANMSVYAWIFADKQAYTVNYARPTIDDNNIRVDPLGRTDNYLQLVDQTVDLYEGRALITEYANPTKALADTVTDPLLQELVNNYGYLTRFFARISPEEMTIDPVFEFNGDLPVMSNIHDLRDFDSEVIYGCKNQPVDIEFDESVMP